MGNVWPSRPTPPGRRSSDCFKADLNARDASGWTQLMQRVRDRDLAGVERHVARGADVDATGVGGMTPLMVAASTGFLDAVTLLLAHGASVSAADKFGKTPLMFAARYGYTAVARALISSGADVNAQDRDGHSPLMFSAESGHMGVVEFLVAAKVEIQLDASNKNGWTPLMFACSEGNFEIVWFLLANFAAINALDNNRRTPLMMAIQSGHLDVAKLLLSREPSEADATLIDKMDNSVLVTLLGSYWNLRRTEDELLPLVDLLLGKGANPGKRNTDGISAVTIALQKGFYVILGRLLDGSVRLALGPVVVQPRLIWTPRSSWEPESEPTDSLFSPSWASSLSSRLQAPTEPDELQVRGTSTCDLLLFARLQNRLGSLPISKEYSTICSRLQVFLGTHGEHVPAILRFVRARVATEVSSDLHFSIDRLDNQATEWRAQWATDCQDVRQQLVECVRANVMRDAVVELSDPSDQELALTLLVYEATRKSSYYTGDELALMRALTSRLSNFAQLEVPEVEDWFIPSHEVEIMGKSFARGAFGQVHHGMWLKTDVVVKCVHIQRDDNYRTFLREVRVWHCAQHRHVVRFYGACHVGPTCFVVCEYASNGLLVEYLAEQHRRGRELAWRKLYQVALGLLFLHQRQIVHGDLKGNNILVSADGTAMLTDFGMSFFLQRCVADDSRPHLDGQLAAMRWRAPEYASGGDAAASFAADVYSLAMCIVEAVTGEPPWASIKDDTVIKHHLQRGTAMLKPKKMTDAQWSLVRSMSARDPAQRLPLSGVIERIRAFADAEAQQGHVL